MIKIENVQVCGLSRVIDFRRSFNSQEKSDSEVDCNFYKTEWLFCSSEFIELGPNDLKLLSALTKNGDSHAKVNRFIQVYHDLTLPRRMWVDYDTYRLGRKDGIYPDDIEFMSDSTMHTIGKRLLDMGDFDDYACIDSVENVNYYISQYLSNKTNEALMYIKSNLPEGFLQTRTVMINYQALRHIYFDRKNHRQPEFKEYCAWIESLPYASELITCERG